LYPREDRTAVTWDRISIRLKIYLLLGTLTFITIWGALIMIWYTYQIENLLTHITDKHVAAFQAAEALETALVNQKGFVTYYFQDGDPEWLKRLGEYRQVFKERLKNAEAIADSNQQRTAIEQIAQEYKTYIKDKDRVIAYYRAGQMDVGSGLHKEVRKNYFNILELCEEYKGFHKAKIDEARTKSHAQAKRLRFIAGSAMAVVLVLASLFILIFVTQILKPIRRLIMETGRGKEHHPSKNELQDLGRSVRGLIEDVDHTHVELERSREHLLQAEKMASVGKLAAGVAHSVRNPLTSVKMRLFSLGRTLRLSNLQREDFDVISEEIKHIDTIVQNFLEFSRPPKLKIQKISPSEVVDLVLQLLKYRLESYDVSIQVERKNLLPVIDADPEQLKEVLVNLVENACEAMDRGGTITIEEEEEVTDRMAPVVKISVTDSGPGIPAAIQEKVLQPFFTTKEEGTGLGLSIAQRIVEEHGGKLDIISKDGAGSSFIIILPVRRQAGE
jgi:signal transduction histidine kinase